MKIGKAYGSGATACLKRILEIEDPEGKLRIFYNSEEISEDKFIEIWTDGDDLCLNIK